MRCTLIFSLSHWGLRSYSRQLNQQICLTNSEMGPAYVVDSTRQDGDGEVKMFYHETWDKKDGLEV